MNVLLLGVLAAGAYAYSRNPEFKAKADKAGESLKDLALEAQKELKEAVEAAKAKCETKVSEKETDNSENNAE